MASRTWFFIMASLFALGGCNDRLSAALADSVAGRDASVWARLFSCLVGLERPYDGGEVTTVVQRWIERGRAAARARARPRNVRGAALAKAD